MLFIKSFNIFKINLVLKYRDSLLGYFWTIINPLSFSIILIALNFFNLINQNTNNQDYFIYVFSGLTTWSIFSDTIKINTNNFSMLKNIFSKLKVDFKTIFVSSFYEILLNFILRLLVFLIILFIFLPNFNFYSLIFNIFLIFITLIPLGILFYLLFFPLSFLFLDSGKILSPLISFLFISSSAVIYSSTNKIFEIFHTYNPIAYTLVMLRSSINKEMIEFSSYVNLFILFIISTMLSFLFYKIFIKKIPILIDRSSN